MDSAGLINRANKQWGSSYRHRGISDLPNQWLTRKSRSLSEIEMRTASRLRRGA